MEKSTPTPPSRSELEERSAMLSWEAHIHPHHERGTLWFLAAGALVFSLLFYSVVTKAWSFTTVILMTVAMYWFIHRDPPVEREMAIFDWGFMLDGRAVEWKDCTGYWFLGGPGYHELHIEHNEKVVGDFIIQTGPLAIEEIHEVLAAFLPLLESKTERGLDTISRICKI